MKQNLQQFVNRIAHALPLCALLACGTNTKADPVFIPDTALSNAVYQALGKSSGPLTSADMLGLTNFYAAWQGIQDTTGLETAQNLTLLNLDGNSLTNLEGFTGLTNLNDLSIRACQLGDLAFVASFRGLTNLAISYNSVSNLAPLAQLTHLVALDAGGNLIQDLSALGGLTNLASLELYQNQVTNLAPLGQMTHLLGLNLDGSPVSDLSPLRGAVQLQRLQCGGTAVTNFRVFTNFSDLNYLEADSAGLTNADFLAGLTNLSTLLLPRNHLTSIPVMACSNVLVSLNLDGNSLGDLGFLGAFPALHDLSLSDMTGMTDYAALGLLPALASLTLNNDALPGLDVLPVLPGLNYLAATGNDIDDVQPLAAFTSLASIQLSWNLLMSIHCLTSLPLESLEIARNHLDFSDGTEAANDLAFLVGNGVYVNYTYQASMPFHITSQPSDQSVVASGDAVFSVSVTGDLSNLRCQWQFDGKDLDGETSHTLELLGVRPGIAGLYRARLKDESTGNYLYTRKARLSVMTNFTIVAPPADTAVAVGETASFSVSAQGAGPFTYRWLRNGADLPAAVVITTFAGKGVGDGGPATEAALYSPGGIATDSQHNLYIADTQNHRVRKVDTNGVMTTIAGNGFAGYSADGIAATNSRLYNPSGVCVDALGNVYFADTWNCRIRKVDANGIISTFAGDGNVDSTGDGGPADMASFAWPEGVAIDSRQNIYIADTSNHRIRKVATNGIITTVAGNGVGDMSGDGGLATNASLNSPRCMVVDGSGNLYIADHDNHRVRKVGTNGIISTMAGDGSYGIGGDGGQAASAQVALPFGLALDGSGNLYVADEWGLVVRRIDTNGIITRVAGNGGSSRSFAEGGWATNTALGIPHGVAWDSSGQLVFADAGFHRILQVDGGGIIHSIAGGWLGDGKAADQAVLRGPQGVTADALGNVFVADTLQDRVRKVEPTGVISTVAGNGNNYWSSSDEGSLATQVRLAGPIGLAASASGSLFIADCQVLCIRKVDSGGIFTTVAGNGSWDPAADSGVATAVGLARPRGVVQDGFGNLFISDTERNCIRKVDTDGFISTIVGNGQPGLNGDGGPAIDAALASPEGLALDAAGSLLIADTGNHVIRKVTSNGRITTVAGDGSGYGHYNGDGGAATQAALSVPTSVAVDTNGNLFIADSGNHRIRMVDTNGMITTVAGDGTAGYSGDGASPLEAELNTPSGVAVDSQGRLFIADQGNNRLRGVGRFQGPTLTISAITAENSGEYSVVVSSPYGRTTSTVATLTVTLPGPLAIVSQPTNQTVTSGDPAGFQVTPGGGGPFSYQWYKDNSPISGATHPYFHVTHSAATDAGSYWVVISNLTDNIESDHVSLAILSPPSLSTGAQPASQTVNIGDPASFCVTPGGTAPFTYQWYKDSLPIPGATDSCYQIAHASAADCASYWVVVSNLVGHLESGHASLGFSQPPAFDLDPTNVTVLATDTVSVYLTAHAAGTLPITYTLTYANGGSWGYTQTLQQDQNVVFTRYVNDSSATESYCIRACNAAGCATSAVATITVHVPANVWRNPYSQSVLKGRGLTLDVTVGGDAPISYQWRKDSSDIPGATSPSLPLAASYEDTGSYSVRVSNSWGFATSSAAAVTVVPCFYTAVNLGALGTNQANSEAFGVNNFGEVVGSSDINGWKSYGNRLSHGFVWPAAPGLNSMVDLGDGWNCINNAYTNRLVGNSAAYGINDKFDIVGFYEYRWAASSDGYPHAAYWRQQNCGFTTPPPPGTHCPVDLVDIHPSDRYVYPPDTEAVAVNQKGQIVLQAGWVWVLTHYGYLLTPGGSSSGFSSWNLGSGNGGWIVPTSINNSGLVVGREDASLGNDQPYRYDGTPRAGFDAMTNAIPGIFTRGFQAVNDLGIIAGYYITNSAQGSRHQFFLLHPNGQLELPADPFVDITIKAINNRNQVVGIDYANRGALYTDGHWFLLNDMIWGGNVNVITANAINDAGQIVGQARFTGAQGYTAYLLTPSAGGSNRPPVAMPDQLLVCAAVSLRLSPSLLLANDSDPDGDSIYLKSVGDDQGHTQMGGKVVYQSGAVFYTPPSGAITSDSFAYRISDGLGGEAVSQMTLTFDLGAPVPPEVINPPQILADQSVLLSGRAPAGAVVFIYYSTDLTASYWTRDTSLIVPLSGQWSIVRPGNVGGKTAFYKAEIQEATGP